MDFGLRRHLPAHVLEANSAVQVVGGRHHHGDENQGSEQPVDDEERERQAEDVERHVLAKQRVIHPKWLVIDEEHPLLPLRQRRSADHEAEQGADGNSQHPAVLPHQLAVASECTLLRRGGNGRGCQAIGNPHVDDQQHGKEHDERSGEANPRPQDLPERVRPTNGIEPQHIDVEACDAAT